MYLSNTVRIVAFPLLQRLREAATMLRHACVAYLLFYKTSKHVIRLVCFVLVRSKAPMVRDTIKQTPCRVPVFKFWQRM